MEICFQVGLALLVFMVVIITTALAIRYAFRVNRLANLSSIKLQKPRFARYTLISVDGDTGIMHCTYDTVLPTLPEGHAAIVAICLPAGATTIRSDDLIDLRLRTTDWAGRCDELAAYIHNGTSPR